MARPRRAVIWHSHGDRHRAIGPVEAILIPVKALGEAKQRLSSLLSPHERTELGLAMLADVLAETARWKMRFIVTRDPQASDLGRSLGCEIVPEHETGLNAALALGTKHAMAAGVRRLLVLPADVPAVSEKDLCALFAFPEQVVIVSSSDGGTTALLRSPPDVIQTAFGDDSARKHLRKAASAGVRARHARTASLLLDVDDYSDLMDLAEQSLERRSATLARKLAGRSRGPGA
jgi:2-phospho-L-lactate guanylyltransferase